MTHNLIFRTELESVIMATMNAYSPNNEDRLNPFYKFITDDYLDSFDADSDADRVELLLTYFAHFIFFIFHFF